MRLTNVSRHIREALREYQAGDFVDQLFSERLFPDNKSYMVDHAMPHLYLGKNVIAKFGIPEHRAFNRRFDLTDPKDREGIFWAFNVIRNDYSNSTLDRVLPALQSFNMQRITQPDKGTLRYDYRLVQDADRMAETSVAFNYGDPASTLVDSAVITQKNYWQGNLHSIRSTRAAFDYTRSSPDEAYRRSIRSLRDTLESGRGASRALVHQTDKEGVNILRIEEGLDDKTGRYYTFRTEQPKPDTRTVGKETFTIGNYTDPSTDSRGKSIVRSGVDHPVASDLKRLSYPERHERLFQWERPLGDSGLGTIVFPKTNAQ